MIDTLAVLGVLEKLEKLNKGKGKKLCRRRSPQLSHPMVELLRHCLCRQGDTLRGREYNCSLSLVLHNIALTEEGAKQTVVVVVMNLFYMSSTLLTVVVDVNSLMMHMQRRQSNHWQISGQ